MKLARLLSILLLSLLHVKHSQAIDWGSSENMKAVLEAQPTCGKFVKFDSRNLYLGFAQYKKGFEEPRSPIPAKIRVAPLNGDPTYELLTNDGAIDVVTNKNTAFVLTYSSIEEWDLSKQARIAEYPTYATNSNLAYKEHAQAMARYNDKLIIAHGRLGISIFDMNKKRIVNQFRILQKQLPLESMATGVTVQGNSAYFLVDSFHLTNPGDGVIVFRGFVIVDLETENVVSELGGLDPGGDSIVSDSKKIIVGFHGSPIWKYGIKSLNSKKIPEPENRVWSYPLKGNPTGTPALDKKYFYTCFSQPGNDGWFTNRPVALDRRVLILD